MRAATKSTLRVDFSTNDPGLAKMLESIAEFSDTTSCRHELEAALYGFLHDVAIRDAEKWRAIERNHKLRETKREERRLKKEAQGGNRN